MDSRMVISRLLQSSVGDMFSVRNAGNLIPHHDSLSFDAITTEPGALELGCIVNNIRHVMVCGHADCKVNNYCCYYLFMRVSLLCCYLVTCLVHASWAIPFHVHGEFMNNLWNFHYGYGMCKVQALWWQAALHNVQLQIVLFEVMHVLCTAINYWPVSDSNHIFGGDVSCPPISSQQKGNCLSDPDWAG